MKLGPDSTKLGGKNVDIILPRLVYGIIVKIRHSPKTLN